MDVCISPKQLVGAIAAPSSKTMVHRALIAAALSDAPCDIRFTNPGKDIQATLACLQALGAHITLHDHGAFVCPIQRGRQGARAHENPCFDCNESGSTFRFMVPIAAALCERSSFTGAPSLAARPMHQLLAELEKQGLRYSWGEDVPWPHQPSCPSAGSGCVAADQPQQRFPLYLHGSISAFQARFDTLPSSQYVTGLMYAASLLDGPSSISLKKPVESLPYIQATISMIEQFGAHVAIDENSDSIVYTIRPQVFVSPQHIDAEGDWSNGAFWLVAGALSTEGILVYGLQEESTQGDKAICDVLRSAGARIRQQDGGLFVCQDRKIGLQAFDVDAAHIPDLVPILCLLASQCVGESHIYKCERLRLKESDRIASTQAALSSLGIEMRESDGTITISGTQQIVGGELDSANDHRIAMMAAIAASQAASSVCIHRAEAVSKSYPHFFDDFALLGGCCTHG